MKRYRLMSLILGLLMLTVGISGCGLFKKVATVTGTVTWSDDDGAIEGAEVLIAGLSATTNADGVYTIDKVPYGEHELVVKIDGTSVHTQTAVINKKNLVVNISIVRPVHYGTVTGTVTFAADNTPVEGVEVAIAGFSATTDASGSYTIENVPYDEYEAEVKVDGISVHTQTVVVDSDNVTANMSIDVKKNANITGTVSRAANLALAGANVSLMDGASQVAVTTTNRSGAFTFAEVPWGTYTLKINVGDDELHNSSVTVNKLGTKQLSAISVEVINGLIWAQSFELVEPGKLPLGHTIFSGPGGELSTTVSHTGLNSWSVEDLHDTTNGLRTMHVPIIPGRTYRAKTYYTYEGHSAGAFYLEFLDASFKRVGEASKALPAGTGWMSYELEAQAPENAVYAATILYYTKTPNIRKTYFDDITIVELPETAPEE